MSKPNEKPNAADKQASQPASKKDADKKEESSVVPLIEKKVVEEKSPRQIALEEFRDTISALEKGVNTKDNLFLSRAVSRMNPLRNKVKVELFLAVVAEHLLPANATSQWIHALLKDVKDPEPPAAPVAMDTDKPDSKSATPAPKQAAEASAAKSAPAPLDESAPSNKPVDSAAAPAAGASAAAPAPKLPVPKAEGLPEVELYLRLFAVLLIIDRGHKEPAAAATAELVKILTGVNRRTIDLIAARVYQYYALTWEVIGKLADIRNTLLTAHRTACLHHDEPSQVTLTNAILRNYLHYNLYSQADKFRLNSKLPDSRSTSQHARYLFYLGIINSIQLHYGDAYGNLSQAIRKAPQKGAIGFRQQAHKWSVVVQLLMGEVPERGVFRQAALQRSLRPYFQITQAVRVGNLALFHQVMTKHRSVFLKDKTLTLIDRLRHNVIKTGLRNINLSYSRISLKEICSKLHLESEVDAEYIVAKAIHDGVIDATIDHDNKAVFSKENIDIYSTTEPQAAFHRRIQLCTDIQHGAVKSLRFPANVEKPKVISAGGGSSEEDAYED